MVSCQTSFLTRDERRNKNGVRVISRHSLQFRTLGLSRIIGPWRQYICTCDNSAAEERVIIFNIGALEFNLKSRMPYSHIPGTGSTLYECTLLESHPVDPSRCTFIIYTRICDTRLLLAHVWQQPPKGTPYIEPVQLHLCTACHGERRLRSSLLE